MILADVRLPFPILQLLKGLLAQFPCMPGRVRALVARSGWPNRSCRRVASRWRLIARSWAASSRCLARRNRCPAAVAGRWAARASPAVSSLRSYKGCRTSPRVGSPATEVFGGWRACRVLVGVAAGGGGRRREVRRWLGSNVGGQA